MPGIKFWASNVGGSNVAHYKYHSTASISSKYLLVHYTEWAKSQFTYVEPYSTAVFYV